jgi:hypothetical protein
VLPRVSNKAEVFATLTVYRRRSRKYDFMWQTFGLRTVDSNLFVLRVLNTAAGAKSLGLEKQSYFVLAMRWHSCRLVVSWSGSRT